MNERMDGQKTRIVASEARSFCPASRPLFMHRGRGKHPPSDLCALRRILKCSEIIRSRSEWGWIWWYPLNFSIYRTSFSSSSSSVALQLISESVPSVCECVSHISVGLLPFLQLQLILIPRTVH